VQQEATPIIIKEAQKAPVKQAGEPPKKHEPKFQAFTGKSYSLKK